MTYPMIILLYELGMIIIHELGNPILNKSPCLANGIYGFLLPLLSKGLPIEKTCIELTPKLPPFWRSELTNAANRPQLSAFPGDFSQGGDSTDVFLSIGESHWISSNYT